MKVNHLCKFRLVSPVVHSLFTCNSKNLGIFGKKNNF